MADPNYYRPDIQGWSSDILPKYADWADQLPDGARCVELGVHHGRSLLFLAEYLYDSGKPHCHVGAIDTWHEEGSWEAWIKNLNSIGDAATMVSYFREASAKSAWMYADDSVDLVFVDADHAYAGVRADIEAWWPKVKRGKVFGGHDYGHEVARAVDEFSLREKVHVQHFSSVWWVVKP